MRTRRSAVLLLGLLFWLAWPDVAQAHARLVASYPPDGSVLAAPPTTVHLWFSEPAQPVGQALIVIAPSGKRVALGPLQSDGLELWAALTVHAPGTYLVIWQVISLDTHPARGRFTFSIGRPGVVPGSPGFATGAPLGLTLQVIARWLHLVGYALGFGPFAFDLLVLSARPDSKGQQGCKARSNNLGTMPKVQQLWATPKWHGRRPLKRGRELLWRYLRGIAPAMVGAIQTSPADPPESRALPRSEAMQRRLWRLAGIGILLMVLAEPLALLAQTASLGSGGLWDTDIAGDALSSSFGRVLAQRLGAALGLWTLLGLVKQGSARAAWAILALAVALALVDGEASHAVSSGPLWLGLPANALHIAAMGAWVGGLATLLTVCGLPELRGHRVALVTCFGRMAAASLAVLALTGVIMACLHLARPSNLVTTSYGQALTAKMLLALAAPLLAVAGRRAIQQRQERWWGLEGLALLLVLALAGLVVSLPPAA